MSHTNAPYNVRDLHAHVCESSLQTGRTFKRSASMVRLTHPAAEEAEKIGSHKARS